MTLEFDVALSIRQPYAWAICAGIKPVENRTWSTRYRGGILIHAGLTAEGGEREALADAQEWARRYGVPVPARLDLGGIVGQARLVDCVERHPSEWFFGPFGFVLQDAKSLPFIPLRGRLGFFDVDRREVRL